MIWKDQRLSNTFAETIWVPTIDFLNAENNQHTNVDQDCKITIKRLGNPLPDDIENFKEARIYKGSENYIRISRKYTITFRCHFNFFYFPFNTDFCNMEFRINKNTKNYVSLEKYGNAVHYVGKDQLTEYHVGGMYTERLTSEEPYSGLVTVIMMEHLYATQLVTIFVPTTLINLISFATFCFKWFDFQNRIIVSLTALLVLSTLFGQIAEHLPLEYHHHYPSPNHTPGSPPLPRRVNSAKEPPHPYKWAMLINRWGCLVTSGLYGIFFLAFWAIALSQKVSEKAKKIVDLENMTMMGYPN
ncbi:hypothetical protein C7M84_008955 [Penaeus vannamei]|uniref:Neurotransmitter-gated ion-channel ligand-binding domain-containing protein n=1 Tax=Penaeus vannamei TaxID=6689 RepID=A0A423T877_PENVA|nr:hypothetical protein C7M84_008955 [Penaeus vannamei]